MKSFHFDQSWEGIKGQLKQKYGQLTDDDLTFAEGKSEELLARLQEKLGLSAEDLNAQLRELQSATGGKMDELKAKASEIAGEVRTKAKAVGEDLKARAAVATEGAKAQAGVAYDQARQKAQTLRGDGEEYVRQNPRESLVAAVLAGFVAGMLIRH